jgi:hypothetical protein
MKRFELIVGIIAVFGIILKILHVPGSGILISLTLSMLAMLYYAFSFALFHGIRLRNIFKKAAYKEANAKRIIGAIGLGWALSALIMGALFKLQSWPGGDFQLLTGLVTLGIILLIASIFYFRNKAEYYKRVIKKIFIYGAFALVLYLTPTTVLVDIYHRNNPDYAEILKKVLADPNNLELQKQLEEIEKKMWQQEKNVE